MEVLPKAHLEQIHTPLLLLKNCNSSTCSSASGDEGTSDVLLTQKIKALDLQDSNNRTKQMETSCLLTPPNTPLSAERMESEIECPESNHHHTEQHDDSTKQEQGEVHKVKLEKMLEKFRITSRVDYIQSIHFDLLIMIFLGCIDGCGKHEVDDDEVFVVELLKGPAGLGLSLVDGVVRIGTSF